MSCPTPSRAFQAIFAAGNKVPARDVSNTDADEESKRTDRMRTTGHVKDAFGPIS